MIGDIFQPTHLLLILLVVLVVLGPKRLPEAGRSLGKGIRDFKDGLSGKEHEAAAVTGSEAAVTDSEAAVTNAQAEPAQPNAAD